MRTVKYQRQTSDELNNLVLKKSGSDEKDSIIAFHDILEQFLFGTTAHHF
jgi:hypothetical protein